MMASANFSWRIAAPCGFGGWGTEALLIIPAGARDPQGEVPVQTSKEENNDRLHHNTTALLAHLSFRSLIPKAMTVANFAMPG